MTSKFFMIGEKLVLKLVERLATEKNIERFVKYYWLVSTFRMMVGFTIMLLILIGGYKFGDLIKWLE